MNYENKKSGRPKLYDSQEEAMDNYNVRLTYKQARLGRRIGAGNLSKGIREAIELVVLNQGKTNENLG
jgi:hypothetical protein